MDESIHPQTRIGHVHLTVANLERCLNFYQEALGFKIHSREGDNARLGAGGEDLLLLTERKDARRVLGTTGLYHFAIMVPNRLELAQVLRRIVDSHTPVDGFADHLVSEAIYLPDPDGNGIEVYRDRPREEWQWANGHLRMATDPLDVYGLLAELEGHSEPWAGFHQGTRIGHIHLHVAHLDEALKFYNEVLGFDLMARLASSAGFLSAGGYHHHIGINTWTGVGAPPPPPNAIGLRYFVIRMPNQEELDGLLSRLQDAEITREQVEGGFLVSDPSQNAMLFTTDASTKPQTQKNVVP